MVNLRTALRNTLFAISILALAVGLRDLFRVAYPSPKLQQVRSNSQGVNSRPSSLPAVRTHSATERPVPSSVGVAGEIGGKVVLFPSGEYEERTLRLVGNFANRKVVELAFFELPRVSDLPKNGVLSRMQFSPKEPIQVSLPNNSTPLPERFFIGSLEKYSLTLRSVGSGEFVATLHLTSQNPVTLRLEGEVPVRSGRSLKEARLQGHEVEHFLERKSGTAPKSQTTDERRWQELESLENRRKQEFLERVRKERVPKRSQRVDHQKVSRTELTNDR